MICSITEEITRNHADLNNSEASIEGFPQSSCKKVLIVSTNSTVLFILLQSKIFPMVASRLFACLNESLLSRVMLFLRLSVKNVINFKTILIKLVGLGMVVCGEKLTSIYNLYICKLFYVAKLFPLFI
jgi:hypothetical protein